MLSIYNSLTQSKEVFRPITPGKIDLYVCGMTVYDLCHIGHARVLVFFDSMVRFLRYIGYQVNYVQNITDIDDKIILRANQNNESITVLTDRFIQAMREDMDRLNVLRPDRSPRATEFVPEIIEMVQVLLDKGYAYVGKNGDVYYKVSRFKCYGQLSHRKLEALRVGARIEPSEDKKDPLDFVLWKSAKPGEPSWDSPWGKGRPGWHIECSAMVTTCLGHHIDIHGGGADLLFPHHENELAQSEAATGEKFSNFWMYVGYLQIEQEKMSKSSGNIFTIREVLEKHSPEVLRFFLLSTHYRKPLNYTEALLTQAHQALSRLYLSMRDVTCADQEENSEFEKQFIAAMEDDFNTPKALSVLFDLSHEINREKEIDKKRAGRLVALLKHLGNVLGFLIQAPEDFLKDVSGGDQQKIETLIDDRKVARGNKQWKEADRIRDTLADIGIVLEDKPDGETIWHRK